MKKITFIAICMSIVIPCYGRLIYVDDDSPNDPWPGDPNDGDFLEDGSIEHPFDAIQEAIDDANDFDTIMVADGTYTGDGNRDIDYWGKSITLQSENGPENCIINCQGTWTEFHRGFYFHNEENSSSVLQGFTIKNGKGFERGGGILCDSSSPTITNNIIFANVAEQGAGICCQWGAAPTITNNIIKSNHAYDGIYYISGGGIYSFWASPIVSNNTISGNYAGYGGGIFPYCSGNIIIKNNTINNNTAWGFGGGIHSYCPNIPLIVTNNIIVDNYAKYDGGGICCPGYPITVASNTIVNNSAGRYGGGVSSWGVETFLLTIDNCIIRGNMPEEIHIGGNSCITDVKYCNVQGGIGGIVDLTNNLIWGTSNVSTDPNFVDPDNNDYHLKSQTGHWDETTETFITDNYTSPCIDAGNPLTPIGWEPYPNGGVINIGAYGGTTEASKSYFGTTSCEEPIVGDINGDCRVNMIDFGLMALHWLEDNNI